MIDENKKAVYLVEHIRDSIFSSEAHIADENAVPNILNMMIDEIIDACEYNYVESYNSDWWNKVREIAMKRIKEKGLLS